MDRSRPVGEKTLAHWLDRAMKIARVPALVHDKFHGLRRKRSTRVMQQTYQGPDDATVLEVILSPRRLEG